MVPYSRRSDVVNRSPCGAGVDSRRPTRRRSSQRLLRRRRRRRQLVVVHTTPWLRLAVRENGITIGFVGRNTTTVALLDETETQQSVTTTKCCCNGDDDSNKNASDVVYSALLTVGQTPCWRWRDCDVCLSAWLATVISRSMQARTIAASADTPPDSRNYVLPCILLQLTAVRHQRRITLTPAVGAERSRPPGHRRPSVWPHHTPVLRQLHWLPVRQRVVFKIAGLVRQSLVGVAAAYLADDCRLLSDVGRRPLRSNSNDMRKLLVPRTHNKLVDRSFSAAGPRLWNDLPPGLRRPGLTFDSFRQSVKTHLFGDRSA